MDVQVDLQAVVEPRTVESMEERRRPARADEERVPTLEPKLDRVLDAALKAVSMRAGSIYILDETASQLRLVCATNLPPELAPSVIGYRPGEGVIGRALAGRRPVTVADAWTDRVLGSKVESAGLRAQVSLPLMIWGLHVGVLNLNARRPRSFSLDEMHALEALAGQAASEIFDARLHAREQSRRERVARLYRLCQDFAAAGDLQLILDLTLRAVLAASAAQSATIHLFDLSGRVTAGVGMDRQGRPLEEDLLPWPVRSAAPVERCSQPVIATGLGGEGEAPCPDLRPRGAMAYAGLPLQSGGRLLGMLFVRYDHPRTFPPDEIQALAYYASQAAGAIERVRLIEEIQRHDLRLANLVRAACGIHPSPRH